jgi:hypothetical protein
MSETAEKVAGAIAILRDAFPRQDFPDRSVALYSRMLADMDGAAVTEAVLRLIRRCTWLPSIAEIRLEVAEGECQLPTAAEAWSVACVPVEELHGVPPHELVMESIKACGGRWNIIHADRPEIIRTQFLRDYEERRRSALLEASGASPTPHVSLEPGRVTVPAGGKGEIGR